MPEDLYAALNLPPDASEEDIRKAHRRLSRKHHPDIGDGDREKFDLVQRSAIVLRDPDKRKRYDETGETGETVDNTQAKIAEVLCESFRKAYETQDIDYTDLIDFVRKDIQTTIAVGGQHKKELSRSITKTEKALKRLKFKGSGSDFLRTMLKDIIRDKKKAIASTDDALGIFKTALEVLVEYEYSFDFRPTMETQYTTTMSVHEALAEMVKRSGGFNPFQPYPPAGESLQPEKDEE